jgi:hypothetical protein
VAPRAGGVGFGFDGAESQVPIKGKDTRAANTLWEVIFRDLGHTLLKSMLHIKDLPSDPTIN